VVVSIPEFRSQVLLSFLTPEATNMVADALNSFTVGGKPVDKENIHTNRMATVQPVQRSKLDTLVSNTVFQIKSPTKSSGLTPSKKKKKKSPDSPTALHPTLADRDASATESSHRSIASSVPAVQCLTSSCFATREQSDVLELELSPEQSRIIETCASGHNVFFTGGAGTGKSHILRHIVTRLTKLHGRDGVFVTATTGLAACAVGGVTVHQFAGIRPGDSTSTSTDSIKQVTDHTSTVAIMILVFCSDRAYVDDGCRREC
jgi:hypothetical protein